MISKHLLNTTKSYLKHKIHVEKSREVYYNIGYIGVIVLISRSGGKIC